MRHKRQDGCQSSHHHRKCADDDAATDHVLGFRRARWRAGQFSDFHFHIVQAACWSLLHQPMFPKQRDVAGISQFWISPLGKQAFHERVGATSLTQWHRHRAEIAAREV